MSSCNDCLVDMICTQQCPLFEIDLERLQRDEKIYLKRCMNNIESETYKISENVGVDISFEHIRWFRDGNIHRDNDQPSLIFYNGSQYWYKNGKCHRDNDQPAAIYSDGTKRWHRNDKLHRDNNQPAIITYGGKRYWYKNGVEYEPM